jgi:exonuclease SbcD
MERSLLAEQEVALDGLKNHLVADPHDLLVVAGDVFDQGVPPEEAVDLLGRFLFELREALPKLPVVIISGNHDSASRLASNGGLLRSANVHLRGTAEGLEAPVRVTGASGETAEVWCVPFLWPGSISHEGRVAEDQVKALGFALERIRRKQDRAHAQLLVSHCFATGGVESESERKMMGQASQVAPAAFDGFDYVALGHLHKAQKVGSNGRYSGSLLEYSFDEVEHARKHPKCVLSVEVSAGKPHAANAVVLPRKRNFACIEGTLEQLLESPEFKHHEDDYLLVRLTEAKLEGQPMSTLRKRFPNLLQLVNPITPKLLGLKGTESAAPADKDGSDLASDFTAFMRHVHGEEPAPEVQAAFKALWAELQKEDA